MVAEPFTHFRGQSEVLLSTAERILAGGSDTEIWQLPCWGYDSTKNRGLRASGSPLCAGSCDARPGKRMGSVEPALGSQASGLWERMREPLLRRLTGDGTELRGGWMEEML